MRSVIVEVPPTPTEKKYDIAIMGITERNLLILHHILMMNITVPSALAEKHDGREVNTEEVGDFMHSFDSIITPAALMLVNPFPFKA